MMEAEFHARRFIEGVMKCYSIRVAIPVCLSSFGFRLLNNDIFYFEFEPCGRKVIMFFYTTPHLVITENEILKLKSSLRFGVDNSNVNLVEEQGLGLICYTVVEGNNISCELLESYFNELLAGYEETTEYVNTIVR